MNPERLFLLPFARTPDGRTPFSQAFVFALVLAAVISVIARTRADVDLWGHVRFGLDILDAHALPTTDRYSFTSDRPWINHEWLSEVIIGLAWRFAGTPGLVGLKLACTLGALWLVAASLALRGIRGHRQFMLVGLAFLGILPRTAHVRPQLFSVLLFAALVRIFTSVDRGHTRALFWTIPIIALWANLHGGWLVGVATVGLWCAGEAYASRSDPAQAAIALACALGASAATLLNPYGAGLWTFLFETVQLGREAIREWGPAWTDAATMIVWSTFALIAASALRRSSRPRNPAAVVIAIAWGLASLRVGRLDAFFALSTIGLMAEAVVTLLTRRAPEAPTLPRSWRIVAVVASVMLLVAIPPARQVFTCIGLYTPRWPEPEAVAFIHQQALSGRIVTYFDWGEYAIWHLAKTLRVSMDGRRETVYSDYTIDRHLQLYRGTAEGLQFLQHLTADYVWLPRDLPAVPSLEARGWIIIFEGPRSVVLASRAAENYRIVRPALTPGSATRCFPGP